LFGNEGNSIVLKKKIAGGGSGTQFQVEEIDMNYDMRPVWLLRNGVFTLEIPNLTTETSPRAHSKIS
jgi:hypothetical protein